MTPITWIEAIDDWTTYLAAVGTPATTLGLRTYQLQRVAREVGGSPTTTTFGELLTWLAGHTAWSPNTRRTYRASLRAFYRWALATGLVEDSPAHLLPPIRIPRARPRPTPEEAFRFAMRIAEAEVRIALMLSGWCGLRRTEVARVRRSDLERSLDGWALRVTGKGGHVRVVPVPDGLALEVRALPDGWVFPSSRRPGEHLTPHHLAKMVSRVLPEGYTMHTLRHRCASVAYAATRDLRAVQELLGHQKPETTSIYTLAPDDTVRAAMNAAAA